MTAMTQRWTRTRHGKVVPMPPPKRQRRADRMMTYPFPLRDGENYCIARLILPDDLTMAEAQRLGNMVQTLAIDHPLNKPEVQAG